MVHLTWKLIAITITSLSKEANVDIPEQVLYVSKYKKCCSERRNNTTVHYSLSKMPVENHTLGMSVLSAVVQ